MKYPQLVSPRAVNAISDWLVSRLEELGVEFPQIYTRLLLSLLQSTVQVNDPIEFANLETFVANQKGGHRRNYHLPYDTETLKKLNAIQCLREIVSAEQQTSAIEKLVDELCAKLNDIEKHTQDFNDQTRFFINTEVIRNKNINENSKNLSRKDRICNQDHNSEESSCKIQTNLKYHTPRFSGVYAVSPISYSVLSNEQQNRRQLASTKRVDNTIQDNDPKKLYFRAFPALSKEMEDSFCTNKRNTKILTWPVVGRSRYSSSIVADNTILTPAENDHRFLEKNINNDIHSVVGLAVASGKKKTKRRRTQALHKGTSYHVRKNISTGNINNSQSSNNKQQSTNSHYSQERYRDISPASTFWDTDFKGCWEMGPDLIKEFLSKQKFDNYKGSKRNRSTSEGLTAQYIEHDIDSENDKHLQNEHIMKRYSDFLSSTDDGNVRYNETSINFSKKELIDYNDEKYDYDENTLAYVSELVTEISSNPRRLYERECGLHKPKVNLKYTDEAKNMDNPLLDSHSNDSADPFYQLKVKFDSNLEALWKGSDGITTNLSTTNRNNLDISSSFYASSSLNALAPFKQDLWNFWSKYNQNNSELLSSAIFQTRLADGSANTGAGADKPNSNDCFSKASNLNVIDKVVANTNSPTFSVFLHNSIWSSSNDCIDSIAPSNNTDEETNTRVLLNRCEESKAKQINKSHLENKNILQKVLNKTENNTNKSISCNKPDEPNSEFAFNRSDVQLSPYNKLKWSEGINGGPFYNSFGCQYASTENSYSSLNIATASFSGANWEAPTYGQTSQPDLKSWCASNPISLTEMYGNDVCDSKNYIQNQNKTDNHGPEAIVTLSNHSVSSSGFIPYTLIKQYNAKVPVQNQLSSLSQSSSLNSSSTKDYLTSTFGVEEENLLTSERTHFHPIENYVDGHSFDISSALDVIHYDRSENGLLSFDSHEYLEYSCSDMCTADDDVGNSSINFINLESSFIPKNKEHEKGFTVSDQVLHSKDVFVLKFRFHRDCEVGCQTEKFDCRNELETEIITSLSSQEESCQSTAVKNTVFNNKYALNRETNNEALIAAVSKAVAVAAKAAAENHLSVGENFAWMPSSSEACKSHSVSWNRSDSSCDDVDLCVQQQNSSCDQVNQNWSMMEVEKQCNSRRCQKTAPNVDIIYENSVDNSHHTLWGICAACNNCDYYTAPSMPANRLLRDELKLEADEIMSDLKNMQDLYIGESSSMIIDCGENCVSIADTSSEFNINEERILTRVPEFAGNKSWSIKSDSSTEYSAKALMLQKVNLLIEGILKTDTQDNVEGQPKDETTSSRRPFINWSSCGSQEHNIWAAHYSDINSPSSRYEQEHHSLLVKPMDILRKVGSALNEDKEPYTEKINWEHENLAKIWQHSPKVFEGTSTNIGVSLNYTLLEEGNPTEEVGTKMLERNNLKNLTNNIAANNATYKKVQDLLNTSAAAKIKLVANRKRRHSASQNFYQHQQLKTHNNNNNSKATIDFNNHKQKHEHGAGGASVNNSETKIISMRSQPPSTATKIFPEQQQHTIITCKYWTTETNGTPSSFNSATTAMYVMAASNKNDSPIDTSSTNIEQDDGVVIQENIFGNTFSYLIDKNTSILKHMTMMTRPLTR